MDKNLHIHNYDMNKIQKMHWSELLKVFNLISSENDSENKTVLLNFLKETLGSPEEELVKKVLGAYILALTYISEESKDNPIFRAIAHSNDYETIIYWFGNNLEKFVF